MIHLFLIFSAALLSNAPAQAQSFLFDNNGQSTNGITFNQDDPQNQGSTVINQYDKKYKGYNPEEEEENTNGGSLIETGYTIHFVRSPDDANKVVNLRFQKNTGIQGCVNLSMPNVAMKTVGSNIVIEVPEVAATPDTSSFTPSHGCGGGAGAPQADIALSYDQLEEENIKSIMFQSGNAKDKYDVQLSENSIRLTPVQQTTFVPADIPGGLTHRFYDQDTLILSAPAANSNIDTQILNLAEDYGLTPAEPLLNAAGHYFFRDKTGGIKAKLSNKTSMKLDVIKIDDIFLGANGKYRVQKPIDVFVRIPGEYD